MLSEIVPILQRIADLNERLDEKGFSIWQGGYIGGGANGTTAHPKEWIEFLEATQHIQKKGVIIKDPSRGLVDFPTIRGSGEEVYLCYLLGEATIDWWHTIRDGFAGRRPVGEL